MKKYQLTQEEYDNFIEIVNDITKNDIYNLMKKYIQHGEVSCFDHCYNVALYSYIYALRSKKKVNLNSIVKGALLHDFFLYDWHILEGRKRWHGFRHPKIALNNALKYYDLNEIEKDIIYKHMWPLTFFKIPKYKESMIVSYIDKKISLGETFKIKKIEVEICNLDQ